MRGDSPTKSNVVINGVGSPPHAWGQRHSPVVTSGSTRFTPTCMGTAQHLRGDAEDEQVHPHMRGDSYRKARQSLYGYGSPPHAWGQRPYPPRENNSARFTPTCVGTALWPWVCWPAHRVHPHMRGDSLKQVITNQGIYGSPPHAWGQRGRAAHRHHGLRFTPTCVGTASGD